LLFSLSASLFIGRWYIWNDKLSRVYSIGIRQRQNIQMLRREFSYSCWRSKTNEESNNDWSIM